MQSRLSIMSTKNPVLTNLSVYVSRYDHNCLSISIVLFNGHINVSIVIVFDSLLQAGGCPTLKHGISEDIIDNYYFVLCSLPVIATPSYCKKCGNKNIVHLCKINKMNYNKVVLRCLG